MQHRGTATVYVPVVGARPDLGGPWLEGAPALRRYQFWARRTARDDPQGATLIPFGIHDLETCRWLQAASGLLHDAVLGRVSAAHDVDTLVVNVTTRDPAGVEGRSGMLGAACGEAAARWLRPGAAALLPMLVATGELSTAGDDATAAGRALLVKAVEGVAPKLAGVQAMLAGEPASFQRRKLLVALPDANLQSNSHDVAEVERELADLQAFCAKAKLNMSVVRARTLADVLAAWCTHDAWCSAETTAQLTGFKSGATIAAEEVSASSGTSPVVVQASKSRFGSVPARGVLIGTAGLLAVLIVMVASFLNSRTDCDVHTLGDRSPAVCGGHDVTVTVGRP